MSIPYSDADPLVPTPLQAHFQQCTYAGGVAHRLLCGAEAVRGFLAPRIVSTLIVTAILVGVILSLQFGTP
jgi:hypothetical protein